MSSTDAQPRMCSAAIGTICSTYSGSAPAVKPSCHQAACSSHSSIVTAPGAPPAAAARTGQGAHIGSLADARSRRRAVQLGVQGVGHLLGKPRQALEVLEAGVLHRRDAAQLLQQPLLAAGAEAGDVVDGALGHALAAQLAVVGDGKAVGLV